ncbi:MAG: hypothetical protein NUV51_09545 [Sulfuricaulis sp.]|nr:hypothetical protein [Sulfuricaulis sp.]
MTSNWIVDAAQKISSEIDLGSLNEPGPDRIADIITAHFEKSIDAILVRDPDGTVRRMNVFKDGVAYMPVPRCETCAWWLPVNVGGECRRLVDSSGLTHGSKAVAIEDTRAGRFARLLTQADFGCVQWKEKG